MYLFYKYNVKTCTVCGVYGDDMLVTDTDQNAVDNSIRVDEGTLDQDIRERKRFLGLRIELNGSKRYN